MPPLNELNDIGSRKVTVRRSEINRFFFLCEGKNTERWYFGRLFDYLNKMDLPTRAVPVYVERTQEDEGASHPKRLAEFAELIRNNEDKDRGYDPQLDKTVIVFDADIYKNDRKGYHALLDEIEQDNIVGVTCPSFELFLLLHLEDAYRKWIDLDKEAIFENKKTGKRRYIDKLLAKASGMNPKTNEHIGDLCERHEYALEEERNLNNDIRLAYNEITSNLGQIIDDLKHCDGLERCDSEMRAAQEH